MNHSSDKPNCYPKIMNVNSDYRIGLYAARDIEPHTEVGLSSLLSMD
jgi:SET domain-containing protein